MISDEELINRVEEILEFLKNNTISIDFNKIKNEISKLDTKLKTSILPNKKLKEIFSNKALFQNLTEVKSFMSKNFKIKIKERSTAGILSIITYYLIIDPTLLLKIQNKANNLNVKSSIRPVKKTSSKKKKVITDKSWRDWIKYKPVNLRKHLDDLTVAQIKSISGKLLTSSEKKVRRGILIENVIRKITKLETHYKMGPG